MLYLGFVTFLVPFAYAAASLITGEVSGDWSRAVALYYNYSKDEPYTGMNEILRQNLRLGLSELAETIKHEPLEYWKH